MLKSSVTLQWNTPLRVVSFVLLLILFQPAAERRLLSYGQEKGNSPKLTELLLPNKEDSLRLAILGDTGTGDKGQYQVAEQVERWRRIFPFEIVLTTGDNLYGSERAKDFEQKFERPYKPLLDAGVKFYSTLGNHDDENQRFYEHFNMGGKRYYTFRPKPDIRFFALDSNYMDREQLEWLEKELQSSGSKWKFCFFHHPLYSSGGKHGSDLELRKVLEPLFLKHGVSVVLAGHEHFYERLKPQNGIYHFVSGASAKLRRGDIKRTDLTAKGFDEDLSFMLVEIAGDELYFQTISRSGKTVDSGVIRRRDAQDTQSNAESVPQPYVRGIEPAAPVKGGK